MSAGPGSAKAEQKERSHQTILESASCLIREKGIAGARVADVMRGAGLTVGGFYAHFSSKEELVKQALRRTGDQLRTRLFSRLEEKPEEARAEIVLKRYLSAAHRDDFARGCAMPAVVGEIGTTAPEHADVLSEQLDLFARELEQRLPKTRSAESRTPSNRNLAIGLVALMYGGITLSRALRGTPLSDEILRACRAVGAFVARSP